MNIEMMFLLWEIMLLILCGQELETEAVFFPLLLLITNKMQQQTQQYCCGWPKFLTFLELKILLFCDKN